MSRFLAVLCSALALATPLFAQSGNGTLYDHMIEANRAQIVMLAERALIDADQAGRIADALRSVASSSGDTVRSGWPDYLELESRLVEMIGPEASNIHLGRSRNDLGAAITRMWLREAALGQLDRIATVRSVLHRMAEEHVGTVMPGFTHAVQAQPTTLAHFLLAFDAGLQRDAQRMREAYVRLNQSPLGSGAFTTSGFALDRPRLAELLGFQGLIENSYDAIMVSEADSKVEYASVLSLSALGIGRFVQYIAFQYDDPVPGILLTGDVTSRSSIMPQKRNPSDLERLRMLASEVVANAYTSAFFVHNTPMYEVKDIRQDHLVRLERFSDDAARMYEQLAELLKALTIRPDILREQVDRDYSTMTELADLLVREAGVSFRTAYTVASELTTYGRAEGKRPLELSREEVADVYRRVAGGALPLSAEQLQSAFDPATIVRNRNVRGGPQPDEIARMLMEQRDDAAATADWVKNERDRFRRASEELGRRFDAVAEGRR